MFTTLILALAMLGSTNVALAATSGPQPESSLKLTQSQVSQIVKKFLGQIGQPGTGETSISPAIPNSLPGNEAGTSPERLSGQAVSAATLWQITVPDPVHPKYLEVSDATGQVIHYIRDDNSKDHQPLETPIPKSQAIARASVALLDAGAMKSGELKFKEAFLSSLSANSQIWFVSWDRMVQGIPYREQGANVTVDAQTGEVTGFSVNFHTHPPVSMAFNVSRDQAKALATQAFADAGMQFAEPPVVKAEIVQPNGYWKPGVGEAERQPVARTAWTCRFKNGRQSYEAWIDAETGEPIGGQYSGPRGARRLTPTRAALKAR